MPALKSFFFLGVVLISMALCADAVIGNVQEKAMKAHKSSNTEMVSVHIYLQRPIFQDNLVVTKIWQINWEIGVWWRLQFLPDKFVYSRYLFVGWYINVIERSYVVITSGKWRGKVHIAKCELVVVINLHT